jgi:hypothetical protein
MSGGHFDYIQHRLTEVIEQIKDEIQKSGKPKTKDELKDEFWRDDEWYAKYPEDLNHHKYSDEVMDEFNKGVELISLAQIYMQRIDWLLSGDDGEETFLERLKEDKDKLNG